MITAPKSAHAYARSNLSRSRTNRVVAAIGRRIVSGDYSEERTLPGDTDLETEFGVSRTVLREAIKTLSGKGLLQSKARIGTRVRPRTDWNLFDPDVLIWHAETGFDAAFLTSLGEMRLVIEPEAAALAARRGTAAQIEELYAIVERMQNSRASQRNFVDADLNFHLTVALMAANPFLHSISTLIEVALVAAFTRSSPLDEPGGADHSANDHRAIADAIAAGDADAARAAMRVVIAEGMQRAGLPAGKPPASLSQALQPGDDHIG